MQAKFYFEQPSVGGEKNSLDNYDPCRIKSMT